MFVASDKAQKELGYRSGPVEVALERAVRWYETCGYIGGRGPGHRPVAHAQAA